MLGSRNTNVSFAVIVLLLCGRGGRGWLVNLIPGGGTRGRMGLLGAVEYVPLETGSQDARICTGLPGFSCDSARVNLPVAGANAGALLTSQHSILRELAAHTHSLSSLREGWICCKSRTRMTPRIRAEES